MDTMQTEIKNTLIELGIQPNLAGYRCLMYAIPMYHDDPAQSVTKQLYPEIGRLCVPKESSPQVEKQIRYAISVAWERGRAEIWEKFFPDGRRPANSEFIARISEALDIHDQEYPSEK